jgi:hypothetical protein
MSDAQPRGGYPSSSVPLARMPRVPAGPANATPVAVTAAESLADTLHRLGYLIDRHHLPPYDELRHRRLAIGVDLADLHDLNRWAEATDAVVSDVSTVARSDLYVACTVIGDVPLRLTCFGKALTP